jgi:hypothetical protein
MTVSFWLAFTVTVSIATNIITTVRLNIISKRISLLEKTLAEHGIYRS